MEKFEIGDKVRMVVLDSRDNVYIPQLDRYMREIGKIKEIRSREANHNIKDCKVQFSDDWWWVNSEWLELVEKANKKKYYNGKAVCVYYPSDDPSLTSFTVGKVYPVKDGIIYDNDSDPYNANRFESIDEFNKCHSIAKFIEFKGFAE